MGSLFIKTSITEDRIKVGQPFWETIEVENFVYLPSLCIEPFAETVRFSDYMRSGGETQRYYHLLNQRRGLTLAVAPSGTARILSGFYQKRQLSLRGNPQQLLDKLASVKDISKSLDLPSYSYICIDIDDGGKIISRLNCFENYYNSITFAASLRVPECLLSANLEEGLILQKQIAFHLQSHAPLSTAAIMPTCDLALILDLNLSSPLQVTLRLQFRRDHEIYIRPASISLIA